jgi:hypothetical protein
MHLLRRVVDKVLEPRPSDGVVLFPAGWFDASDEPRTLYEWAARGISKLLRPKGRRTVVCVGVDGSDGCDQTALAITDDGIVSIARKFHPAPGGEADFLDAAADHLCIEDGHEQVFSIGGKKMYLAVCYDTFGIQHKKTQNPGVDAVLSLIHGFGPENDRGGGSKYFTRNGLLVPPSNGGVRSLPRPFSPTELFMGIFRPGLRGTNGTYIQATGGAFTTRSAKRRWPHTTRRKGR